MRKAVALLFIAMLAVPSLGCGNPSQSSPPKNVPSNPASPPKSPPSKGGRNEGTIGNCSLNGVKLGACVDLLSGLVNAVIGDKVVDQCCPVLKGVAGVEAAVCLCTTIKAKLLDVNVFLPLSLQLISSCGHSVPEGFKCPSS